MKYIVMCGGDYTRWETPRQLTKIQGEALVERTIRLLKDSGAEDINISSLDPRFEEFGVPVLHHENDYRSGHNPTGCWVDAFYPTEEPACYLMGDVFFSPEAIKTIVKAKTRTIDFFASAPPFSRQYIKPHAEPFAFKVVDQKRFRAAISFVKANAHTGIFVRRPIAWELWQVIIGEAVRTINFNSYTIINDYTCDVDSVEDIKKLELLLGGTKNAR